MRLFVVCAILLAVATPAAAAQADTCSAAHLNQVPVAKIPSVDNEADNTAANKLPITADVVDRVVTGLRAEQACRNRLIADPAMNADVVKFWHREERMQVCETQKATADAQVQALNKQAQDEMTAMYSDTSHAQAHVAKSQELQKKAAAMEADKDKPCDLGPAPASVQSYFDAHTRADWAEDNEGAKAAGMPIGQYYFARTRVVATVVTEAHHGQPNHTLTPAERAAALAKTSAILPLVALDYPYRGEDTGLRRPE